MANVKTTMTDIRVIIREFSRGTSLREMERKLKLSRTSLRTYRERAEASGKCMIDLLKLNAHAYPKSNKFVNFALITELQRDIIEAINKYEYIQTHTFRQP